MSYYEESDCELSGYDETQKALMEEVCIKVDTQDRVLGPTSKRECHTRTIVEETGLLHRAFSVFLFDHSNRLLLQKRSSEKITFPDCWANTCCSHPLHVEKEMIEDDQIGVKNAAIRKLEQELGIRHDKLTPASFHYLTRIHYEAACDELWSEHEIDYILFLKPEWDVTLAVNPNEVAEARFVDQDQARQLLAEDQDENSPTKVSPWFRMIANELLFPWWDALTSKGDLSSFVDHKKIHRLTE